MSRRALCSAGSLWLGSPASLLARRAPTPRRPSRRASFPSFGGTAAIQRSETTRSPRFLENPSVHALLPSDLGGIVTPGHSGPALLVGATMLSSAFHTASTPTTTTFRGSITRPARSLSTLRSHGHPSTSERPRKTRFRLVAHLGRAGFEPAGFHREVSALTLGYVIASSSPKLRLAHVKMAGGTPPLSLALSVFPQGLPTRLPTRTRCGSRSSTFLSGEPAWSAPQGARAEMPTKRPATLAPCASF